MTTTTARDLGEIKMAIPNDFVMVQQLEAEGFFSKARQGDSRACGLFARLVAYRLNPTGDPGGWGCLTKQPGQAQVDGYSEDGIVYSNNSRDFANVVDIIIGSGEPGASIAWQHMPRRPGNEWERPKPLTALETDYLKAGSGGNGTVVTPPTAPVKPPCPDPAAHQPRPPMPDRSELLDEAQALDAFYSASEGLRRPQGLSIDGRPDWEGVAAWLLDVYLVARLAGQSRAVAREAYRAQIRASHEWKSKHPGGQV